MPNFYIKLFFHPIAGFNGNQKGDHDPEEEMASKVLDPANPVFKERNASSKIQTVIEKLNEVRDNYKETGVMEKAVIVSQWTSMLNVLKIHVKEMGFKVCEINGQIPVSTVPTSIKDAASIQKLFFEPTHYDAFYQKSFTCL